MQNKDYSQNKETNKRISESKLHDLNPEIPKHLFDNNPNANSVKVVLGHFLNLYTSQFPSMYCSRTWSQIRLALIMCYTLPSEYLQLQLTILSNILYLKSRKTQCTLITRFWLKPKKILQVISIHKINLSHKPKNYRPLIIFR